MRSFNNDDRNPIAPGGQTYRHYKGSLYKVIRVDKDFRDELKAGIVFYYLSPDRTEYIAVSEIKRGDTAVFYQGESQTIWAKSLQNFTEHIPVKNCDRFTLVEESKG